MEVPKLDARQNLVETAHLLGHFSIITTTRRLQETYFWTNMDKDVTRVIKSCLSCNRINKGKIFHHPAQVLPIIGLFDRVGIDLVLGLPSDNEEKYNGILVITEYLSKYPYAVAIKSKKASEIAHHLFNYISIFGPPKTILSDQRRDFVNETVDK